MHECGPMRREKTQIPIRTKLNFAPAIQSEANFVFFDRFIIKNYIGFNIIYTFALLLPYTF